MKMSVSHSNVKELTILTKKKLLESHLIPSGEDIVLCPHHQVVVHGKPCCHYIISCLSSGKQFFLKILKDNDSATHCNQFLRQFRNESGDCPYPLIVAPGFNFCNERYFLYTFSQGKTLQELAELKEISQGEWESIASKLRQCIDNLSTVHSQQYSDHNQFVANPYADILKRKIMPKLNHQTFSALPSKTVNAVYQQCANIIESSVYSEPTLLHMDIKPANVVYNLETKMVSLLDFELARFGDFDYGWTQLLVTSLKNYGKEYQEYVYPHLIKGGISMEVALQIPKFQFYLFYQAACNLIYYDERKLSCPIGMKSLFTELFNQLSKA